MKCHECGCRDNIRDGGSLFCAKCGIELEDAIEVKESNIPRSSRKKLAKESTVEFSVKPQYELLALQIGIRHHKLCSDLNKYMKISRERFEKGIHSGNKKEITSIIANAYAEYRDELNESKNRFKESWSNIEKKFFKTIEELTGFEFAKRKYQCVPSISCGEAFNIENKSAVILQYRWRTHSNYMIAREITKMHLKSIIKNMFAESYEDKDNDVLEIVTAFLLLKTELAELFPESSLDKVFDSKQKYIAEKVLTYFTNLSFKEFLIAVFNIAEIEKTVK